MKKLWCVLVFLSLGLAQVPQGVLEAKRAFVHVWEINSAGSHERICSGFARGVHLVATAGHCAPVRGKQYFISVPGDATLYPARVLSTVTRWPNLDQALLQVGEEAHLSPVYQCKGLPNAGDAVYTWAGPLGTDPILRVGIFSGAYNFPDNALFNKTYGGMLATSINIDKGASGSMMLSGEGCAWGILVGTWSTAVKLDGATAVPLR